MAGAVRGVGIIIMLVGAGWIVLVLNNAPPTTYGAAAALVLIAPAIGTLLTGFLFIAFGSALDHLRRIEKLLAAMMETDRG